MKSLKQRLLHLTRALHTYLTMLALLLLTLFALTGLLMNHEDALGLAAPHITNVNAHITPALLADHLQLVELLRKSLDARGQLVSLDDSPDEIRLQFASPGRKSDFTIHRDGGTEIIYETRGLIGLAADLHTGKNTTLPWKLIIDASALLLLFASLSGLILWLSIPKRRTLGLLALSLSLILCLATYFLLTP
jgi:uncharacterized protein